MEFCLGPVPLTGVVWKPRPARLWRPASALTSECLLDTLTLQVEAGDRLIATGRGMDVSNIFISARMVNVVAGFVSTQKSIFKKCELEGKSDLFKGILKEMDVVIDINCLFDRIYNYIGDKP